MKCKNEACGHEVEPKTAGRGRKPKYCLACRTATMQRKATKVAKTDAVSSVLESLDLS